MEGNILDETTNAAVVQLPGRKFPGIVIQGDSLSILLLQMKYIKEHLNDKGSEELQEEVEDLYNKLKGLLNHYENVLAKNGIEIP